MIYDPFFLICCSVSKSYLTLCDHMDCSTAGFPVLHYLPEFTQIHVHSVSDTIQPSHPLSPLLLPSIFPSIRVFSNESDLHIRWPKHWSFSFSISPSDGYSWSILPPNIYQAFAMCQCCVHCSTWRLCFHPHSNLVMTGTLNISTSQIRKQKFTQVRWLDKDSKQQSQDWSPSHLSSLLFSFLRVLEPPRLTWSWDTLKAGDKSETRGVLGSLLTLSLSPHSVFPSLHSPLPTASSSPPIFITLPYKTAYNFLVE